MGTLKVTCTPSSKPNCMYVYMYLRTGKLSLFVGTLREWFWWVGWWLSECVLHRTLRVVFFAGREVSIFTLFFSNVLWLGEMGGYACKPPGPENKVLWRVNVAPCRPPAFNFTFVRCACGNFKKNQQLDTYFYYCIFVKGRPASKAFTLMDFWSISAHFVLLILTKTSEFYPQKSWSSP